MAPFFANIRQLLIEKAEIAMTPGSDVESEEHVSMIGNAVTAILGIAVLSGNFGLIIEALESLYAFEKAASKDLSDKVFAQCSE